jgi:phenazine biosynthesis protein phzE
MTLLDDVVSYPAFALIRLQGAESVTVLGGARVDHDDLGGVPLEQGPPPPGRRYDRLLCVPYAQIRERGFEAHDDGTPLTSIDIDLEAGIPTAELLALLPDDPIETT